MSGFAPYEFHVGGREDGQWSTYFEFLHPSQRDMQFIFNRRVCDQLKSHGDNLEVARDVDHRVYLKNQKALHEFENFLSEQGFKVSNSEKEGIINPTYILDFLRNDAPVEIDSVVLPIFDKVMELGGEYDGWGCGIVT